MIISFCSLNMILPKIFSEENFLNKYAKNYLFEQTIYSNINNGNNYHKNKIINSKKLDKY